MMGKNSQFAKRVSEANAWKTLARLRSTGGSLDGNCDNALSMLRVISARRPICCMQNIAQVGHVCDRNRPHSAEFGRIRPRCAEINLILRTRVDPSSGPIVRSDPPTSNATGKVRCEESESDIRMAPGGGRGSGLMGAPGKRNVTYLFTATRSTATARLVTPIARATSTLMSRK